MPVCAERFEDVGEVGVGLHGPCDYQQPVAGLAVERARLRDVPPPVVVAGRWMGPGERLYLNCSVPYVVVAERVDEGAQDGGLAGARRAGEDDGKHATKSGGCATRLALGPPDVATVGPERGVELVEVSAQPRHLVALPGGGRAAI